MTEFTARFSVVKDFTARLNDELTMAKGDVVELISDDSEFGDGWYMGKNLSTGMVGLYPKVFTKKIEVRDELKLDMPQKPGLLRSRSRRTQNSPIDVSFNSSLVDASDSIVSSTSGLGGANGVNESNGFGGAGGVKSSKDAKGVPGYVNDIEKALKELSFDHADSSSPEHEPAGELNTNEVDLWTPVQVAQYMSFLGFDADTANKFIKHKISGGILMELELSHLKELDIDSFGTRYEVFKEIEELKKAFNNKGTARSSKPANAESAAASAPAIVVNDQSESEGKQRTPELQVKENQFDTNQFLSPRRAPRPPSYPSPVASNPVKFGLNSPEKQDRVLVFPQAAHSRNSSMGAASSIYMDTTSLGTHKAENVGFTQRLEAAGNVISNRLSTIINGTNGLALDLDTDPAQRRSVSAKEYGSVTDLNPKDTKRVQSTNTVIHELRQEEASTSSRSSSPMTGASSNQAAPVGRTSTFKSLTQRKPLAKTQTSAFQEGIQHISVEDAIKTASYSGWMFKRGSTTIGSWKQRFFTLHKTRLSYFTSMKDTKERGLIDITSHKVLPANDAEDKLSAVYAASAGYGRYMFKIVPPAPGSRMGLTFTQQKVHYFAVETREEMREWMSALMKATIEVDETVPVISSCVTPTIPLQRAQELMAIARETAQENLQKLQKQREANQTLATSPLPEDPRSHIGTDVRGSRSGTDAADGPDDSGDPYDLESANNSSSPSVLPRTSALKGGLSQITNGMSTPYLVTSGLMTPNNPTDGVTRGTSMKSGNVPPIVTRLDSSDFSDASPSAPPTLSHSNSFRRVLSLRRNRD